MGGVAFNTSEIKSVDKVRTQLRLLCLFRTIDMETYASPITISTAPIANILKWETLKYLERRQHRNHLPLCLSKPTVSTKKNFNTNSYKMLKCELNFYPGQWLL